MLNIERYYKKLEENHGINFAIRKDTHRIVDCDKMVDCSNCIFSGQSRRCSIKKLEWLMEEAPSVDLETLDFLKSLNADSIRRNDTKGELELVKNNVYTSIPYVFLNFTKVDLAGLKPNEYYKIKDLIAEGEIGNAGL